MNTLYLIHATLSHLDDRVTDETTEERAFQNCNKDAQILSKKKKFFFLYSLVYIWYMYVVEFVKAIGPA